MSGPQSFRAGRIFDGRRFREGVLVIEGGRVAAIGAARGRVRDLGDGILAPGLVDLQVNGAGGVQVDGAADAAALARICAVQARMGTTACLPTLVTDTPEATARVIAAGIAAARAGVAGFLGLHLEGPHLDPRRAGAHDPALIRPMGGADLARLCAAARALPALMVTLAPGAASPAQIAALAAAGAVVSLGHSACTLAEAEAAAAAGARAATHLFNAMAPIAARAPGLAGAVLGGAGRLAAGLIADGVHVDPALLRAALAARRGGLFLVTDCMAVAGTALAEMTLGGRRVTRREGRLVLADGTLAGADLDLPRALRVLTGAAGATPARALAMATSVPAAVIGRRDGTGRLVPGGPADFVHLSEGLELRGVWRGGAALPAD